MLVTFCLSHRGQTFLPQMGGGTNKLFVPRRMNISHTYDGGGDKHFHMQGGQTFYVGSSDDVEKVDMSEANFLVSKANIFVS